ncbi:MAG: nuclear transport factor 2 family protein [Thermodesulfobacteriota bacterium]
MDATTRASEERRIRERIASWAKALRAKDLDGLLAHYARDFVSFDLAPPLRHGGEEVRRSLAEWFPTWDGPIGYELGELTVVAGDEVAFAHGLHRLHGKKTYGTTEDVWFRATIGFRKTGGEWLVVHEHTSVPFYMDGSYRAAVDLAP